MHSLSRYQILTTMLVGVWVFCSTPAGFVPAYSATSEKPASNISPAVVPQEDLAIERRLREIFSELEGVKSVSIDVRAGVVNLTGEVASPNARSRMIRLARQVQGVVDVSDKTTLIRDVRRQIEPAVDRLGELVSDIVAYLPLLVLAAVILLFFWFLAYLIGAWDGLYRRFTTNRFLSHSLRQLTKLTVVALGLLIALELLDATALIGTVLGAAGLLGLALGFALRDTVENYVASILLSMKQPFVHNDWVEIDGHEGHVIRLTSRATIVMTLDGNHVRIPNAIVFNRIVINYTRNPQRRFHVDIGVSVDTNLSEAQNLAARVLLDMDGVIADPPPRVDLNGLGDFNVVLRAYGWVDQREFDFAKVKSEAMRLVKEAFDMAGIVMPEPSYRVSLQEPDVTLREPQTRTAGPTKAIDVQRRTEIERQIAEDRRESGDADLLRTDGPLE